MPAILAHHLFGRALLARYEKQTPLTREVRDAFLLGNQGPDPLFFAVHPAYLMSTKSLARRMHREGIEEYFEAWRNMLNRSAIKDHTHKVLRAYVHGALCHYRLDRTIHPLVCAHVEALCSAGIKGLDPKDASFVHGQLEADLDVYLLYQLTGCKLEEYCIPKQVLYASDETLSGIDALYGAAAGLYRIKVPRKVFSRSIKDMRKAQKLLYSPGGTKRTVLGHLERLVRRHSLLQAVSHSSKPESMAWFINEDHGAWLHPTTNAMSTQSFDELFDAALKGAPLDRERFDAEVPLIEITQGLDYFGNTSPCTTKDVKH